VTGSAWVTSYVLLWIAVVVLSLAVAVLLRQIGVLHARLRPQGVHPANEGPESGGPAPVAGRFAFGDAALTLLAFTSPTCELCAALLPSLRAIEGQYRDVAVTVVEHGPGTLGVFRAYRVTSTPYVVAVDRDGVVRGGGVANTLEQVEELLEQSLERA
jgi:hypothetical protein